MSRNAFRLADVSCWKCGSYVEITTMGYCLERCLRVFPKMGLPASFSDVHRGLGQKN